MNDLGRAGEAMNEAESSLGEGNADSAVNSQGRALDALRKGAQGLAQSMQQQLANGLPPKVEPCEPGVNTSMTSRRATNAETGSTPPPSALPTDEAATKAGLLRFGGRKFFEREGLASVRPRPARPHAAPHRPCQLQERCGHSIMDGRCRSPSAWQFQPDTRPRRARQARHRCSRAQFVFNQFVWNGHYQCKISRIYFRADAAFAMPEV